MSRYDIAHLIVVAIIFLKLVLMDRKATKRYQSLQTKIDNIEAKQQSRQTAIRQSRANTATPKVDAKSVTTRRNTDDLPKTGRESRLANVVYQGGTSGYDYDSGLSTST